MKKTFLFFIFLFLISCLGQISSDLYLPALPTIRDAFHTTARLMQLSLAIYMLGFSLSHLIYGPISDYTGRKNPLLFGISICILGTLFCRFSSNIEILLIGRLLQGAGAGAGAGLAGGVGREIEAPHGTSNQRVRWFRSGLESGDVSRCDTFAASRL